MTLVDQIRPSRSDGPERKIPAALVAAFLLQTAGALLWAGSAAERLTVLEHALNDDQAAIQKVAVLEEQMRAVRESLGRIETKLDHQQQ